MNFKATVNVAFLEKNAWYKTKALVLLKYDVLITEGWRSVNDKNERWKTHPEKASHVIGLGIDLRPMSVDGEATTWQSKNYDRVKTQALVNMVLTIDADAKMLFNDPEIRGVKPFRKHDNHIHVTWGLKDIASSGNVLAFLSYAYPDPDEPFCDLE